MNANKLFLLPAGQCLIDSSALDTRRTVGKMVQLPIWSYLIETPEGPILIDTGMPFSCLQEPEKFFAGTEDDGLIVPLMAQENLITNLLLKAGYQREDLLCIVSTHLHFDHAGGNQLFPQTEIVIQQAEYEAALRQDNYFDICKDPTLRYRFVNGDVELAPGVKLLFTPGHTPGHQSVLVHTAHGPILLTVDASYCRENFENGVPFAVSDEKLAEDSISRLKAIAKEESAQVFFGHDAFQEKEWLQYPRFY